MPNSLLIMCDWFHPGYKAGGPIRSVVNIVNLLADEYQIYVLTSDRDHGDQKSYEGIELDKWVDFEGKAKLKYLSQGQQTYGVIKENIRAINPGFIYLNSMFSKFFAIYPIFSFKNAAPNSKLILSPRGMLQAGAMHFKTTKKKLFLLLLKISGKINNLYFHATDEQEKNDIIQHLNVYPERIKVIGNIPGIIHKPKVIKKEINNLKLIYISRIVAKKNLLFLLEILNVVSPNYSIQLTICGGVEHEKYWDKCLDVIKNYPKNIKVEIKGAVVYDEIQKMLEEHHAFILPTLGENFGHAIFESLSSGRPVIISDQTPWRDLENKQAGWDIPLNQPDKFQDAISKLADMDQKEYDVWCEGARKVALSYIEESNLKSRYLELFN